MSMPGPRPGGRGPGGPMMSYEKPKNTGKTLKRLVLYIGKSKYLFFALMTVMLLITFLTLAAPSIQQVAIDAITLQEGQLHINSGKLIGMLALLGAVYAATSLFTYLQGIFSARLSQNTVRTMRRDLFSKLIALPISYTDTHNHGDLMSRMTNDVENISNTIAQSIGSLLSGVLMVMGAFCIMLYYSPLMTLVSVSTIILTLLCSYFMSKFMRRYFTKQQTLLGELNGHVEEMITGYKTVVAFNKQQDANEEFQRIGKNLRRCGIKAQILGGSMGPLMNVISNFGFLLIVFFGGRLALQGAITVGTIQAFILYSKQFTRPINEIANQYAQIQTAIAGAERVFAVMDAGIEQDLSSAVPRPPINGNIEFEHVVFGYRKDEPVLNDLNLRVKQGQKIAIVGATGSGKTTIVNLLTRFYDINEGSIRIDGIDITEYPREQLRRSIAIVLQDTVLFSDDIAANIRYGRLDATDGQIAAAAHTANADRFIDRLPEKYHTQLTEGGGNLSQGQRQLLSIARAVLADPKILILDEATSNVDTRTEMHIQSAMIALMQSRTSLIIAHRLSTIRDADRIVVIDGGRVAECGSHEELLKKQGCYYRLYQNQYAGMET